MLNRFSIILVYALLFTGCKSQSFVGRRVDNFKAYYNTFYNAREAYDIGFESIEKRDRPVDRGQYMFLFVRPSGNTGNREFDKAVVKSADLLRKHQDSKWVDDALLLIGKAYFYQENIVGAIQKFREVINRQSELEDEARFWLARTLIISRSYDEAHTFLQESLGRENIKAKWSASYRLALGELFVQRSDWPAAAEALSLGLTEAKDKDLSARAQFLLGQVFETMGREADAVEAFRNVKRFTPLYELGFAAKLSSIRVAGMGGATEASLKDLRKMERDDKNFVYIDDLAYLRGRILQAAGEADEAYNIYFDLLYDESRTVPIKGDLQGTIHYALGELYRDLDRDFVNASAHFDTAAVSLTRSSANVIRGLTGEEQFSAEAITDASAMKTNFGTYAAVHKEVAEMDSLLWLGSMDQEDFESKILEIRREQARIMEEQRKLREARLLEQQFRQAAQTGDSFANRNLPPSKVNPGNDPQGTRSGFLFHRDAMRVDEGRSTFESRWGDRPLVPNWRRIEAVRGQPVDLAFDEETDSDTIDLDDPATLPVIDTSGVPRDSLAQEEMKSKRAVARYELGNALFLALSMPDSAATLYRLVIEENGDEPVARQSFYALAEVQKALGDSLSASRIYDQIVMDYPLSEFATKIREQRGEQIVETEPDSVALALNVYRIVFDEWNSGSIHGVIDQMILIAAAYPGTEASAKALLAGAQVHLEEAGADTVAVLAQLAIMLPDSIIAKVWPEKFGIVGGPADSTPSGQRTDTPSKTATDSTGRSLDLSGISPDSIGVDTLPSDSLQAQSTGVQPFDTSNPDSMLTGVAQPDSLGIIPTYPDSLGAHLVLPDSALVYDPPQDLVRELEETPDSLGATPVQVELNDSRETDIDIPAAVSPASYETADQKAESGTGDWASTALFVEDLFDVVVRDFGRTPYAKRAGEMLSVIDELRNPPVLLEEQSAVQDSTGAQTDSLDLAQTADGARSDSLGLSPDSQESFPDLLGQIDRVIPDSSAAFDATGNPFKGTNENQLDDRPNPVVAQPPNLSDSPFAHITVDENVFDENLDYVESSVLKPMYLGRFDREVVGWTVALGRTADLDAAETIVGDYDEYMDVEDQPVMILGSLHESLTNYVVAWGIFPSVPEMMEAVLSLEIALPAGHFFLLMKPPSEE